MKRIILFLILLAVPFLLFGWGQDIRLKTPSSGIMGRTPSSGLAGGTGVIVPSDALYTESGQPLITESRQFILVEIGPSEEEPPIPPLSTPVLLNALAETTIDDTVTSNSISPSANALLVALVGWVEDGVTNPEPFTCSDSLTGTSAWTVHVTTSYVINTGIWNVNAVICTAVTGSSPGSGTVTVTSDGTATGRKNLHVVEVSQGYDASTPVRQTKAGGDPGTGATTLTLMLDSTPLSTSIVFGVIGLNADTVNGVTPGATFTELGDTVASAGESECVAESQYDEDDATTTVDWDNGAHSSADGGSAGVAVEIQQGT